MKHCPGRTACIDEQSTNVCQKWSNKKIPTQPYQKYKAQRLTFCLSIEQNELRLLTSLEAKLNELLPQPLREEYLNLARAVTNDGPIPEGLLEITDITNYAKLRERFLRLTPEDLTHLKEVMSNPRSGFSARAFVDSEGEVPFVLGGSKNLADLKTSIDIALASSGCNESICNT